LVAISDCAICFCTAGGGAIGVGVTVDQLKMVVQRAHHRAHEHHHTDVSRHDHGAQCLVAAEAVAEQANARAVDAGVLLHVLTRLSRSYVYTGDR
jgi:hypothetical protein